MCVVYYILCVGGDCNKNYFFVKVGKYRNEAQKYFHLLFFFFFFMSFLNIWFCFEVLYGFIYIGILSTKDTRHYTKFLIRCNGGSILQWYIFNIKMYRMYNLFFAIQKVSFVGFIKMLLSYEDLREAAEKLLCMCVCVCDNIKKIIV